MTFQIVCGGGKEIEVKGDSIENAADGAGRSFAFLVVKDGGAEVARFDWDKVYGWYQGSRPATAEVPM